MDDNNVLIDRPVTEVASRGNLMVSALLRQDVTQKVWCSVPLPAQMAGSMCLPIPKACPRIVAFLYSWWKLGVHIQRVKKLKKGKIMLGRNANT